MSVFVKCSAVNFIALLGEKLKSCRLHNCKCGWEICLNSPWSLGGRGFCVLIVVTVTRLGTVTVHGAVSGGRIVPCEPDSESECCDSTAVLLPGETGSGEE